MKINIITTRDSGLHRHSIDIPTGWGQVTFKQYTELLKFGNDTIKILSVFTGLDETVLKKATIKNLSAVTACLHFLQKPPVYRTPSQIMGHRIVKNLETESIAQYADLQTIIEKFKTDDHAYNLSLFPLIVATYCIHPYDFQQAEYLAPKLVNAPCLEVLAVANFTLVKLRALRSGIVPTSPPIADTPLNRFRQALIDWLESLASSIRYVTWKRSLGTSERNYLNGR